MVSDDAFYLKSIAEIIGSFLLYLFLGEYPKVCVNLQTDVR